MVLRTPSRRIGVRPLHFDDARLGPEIAKEKQTLGFLDLRPTLARLLLGEITSSQQYFDVGQSLLKLGSWLLESRLNHHILHCRAACRAFLLPVKSDRKQDAHED